MAKIDLNAVREEAKTKRVIHTVVVGEDEFQIPALEDWSLDALENVQRGEVSAAFREAMGDDDWERLAEHELTGRDLKVLLDELSEGQGLGDSGNSLASSGGSRKRGTKSKRT